MHSALLTVLAYGAGAGAELDQSRDSRLKEGITTMLHLMAIEDSHSFRQQLLRSSGGNLKKVHNNLLEIWKTTPSYDANLLNSLEQVAEIKVVVKYLALEPSQNVASEWKRLANRFHKYTHRKALGFPRLVDEDFLGFVDALESLLEHVLEAFKDKYAHYHRLIEDSLKIPSPTQEDVEHLLQDVPNNPLILNHFFKSAGHSWLRPLRSKGVFEYPGDPNIGVEALWGPMLYLKRMVDEYPEDVWELTISLPDDIKNPYVSEAVCEIAQKVPIHLATQIMPQIMNWIAGSHTYTFPEKVANLALRFLANSRADEGLQILGGLLAVHRTIDNGLVSLEAHFDEYMYGHILDTWTTSIIENGGEKALILFCDIVQGLERSSDNPSLGNMDGLLELTSSRFRRITHINNMDIGERLIATIQLILANLSNQYGVDPRRLYEILIDYDASIFRDIRLSFLSEQIYSLADKVRDYLLDQNCYTTVSSDFGRLLHHGFKHLNERDQLSITEWISTLEDRKAFYWFEIIADWLPSSAMQNYNELLEQFGHFDPLDESRTVTSFIGPTSPVSQGQLSTMPVQNVVEYLQNWKPTSEFASPSSEGLSRELAKVVADNSSIYADSVMAFVGTSATYVRGLINGLADAAKQGKDFSWEATLEICQWISDRPREFPQKNQLDEDADPHWGWTRQEVARLIEIGLSLNLIASANRERVWHILQSLMNDPDPTIEDELAAHNNPNSMTPFERSINSVRGITMHAIMHYGIWVKTHLKGNDASEIDFSNIPELRDFVISTIARDHSATVRSVLGEHFYTLYWLDRKWVKDNVQRIFGFSESSSAPAEPWNTFLLRSDPSNSLLPLLEPLYIQAVEALTPSITLGKLNRDHNVQLAWHVVSFYCWWGQLELQKEDSLLRQFFKRANPALIARAIGYVGENLSNSETVFEPAIENRLKELWSYRLGVARAEPHDKNAELVAFASWFASGKFDDEWILNHFLETLRLQSQHSAYQYRAVFERLQSLLPIYPELVLHCLLAILTKTNEYWTVSAWESIVRSILTVALKQNDVDVRALAHRIISRLMTAGHLGYGDLLSA